MSEIGNRNIQLSLSERAPPASATVNIANDDISELSQQAKLNQERIELFRYAVAGALLAFGTLVGIFCWIIVTYLRLVEQHPDKMLSSNFWHIPLMVAIMATSILAVTLKLSAHFGKNETPKNDMNLADSLPIWQELINAIKSLKSN